MLREAGECSVNPGGVAGRVHSLTRPGGEERFITQPLTRPSPVDHPSEKLPLFYLAVFPHLVTPRFLAQPISYSILLAFPALAQEKKMW